MAATSSRHASSKRQAWFCTTGLPSDIVFEVDDTSFHLHKFPLMSKSKKIHRLLSDPPAPPRTRQKQSINQDDDGDDDNDEDTTEATEIEEVHDGNNNNIGSISLPDFPGGPGTFEACAKFCYGAKLELTAWNVAPLRCAAEYLEMTEEHADDNLMSRAETYFSHSILGHPDEAMKALKSCEDLSPLAESLGIVDQCINAIVGNISGVNSSWFKGLTILGLPMYKRVMAALATSDDVGRDAVEHCIVNYAKDSIPGLSRSARRRAASAPVVTEVELRELLEVVIASLPREKSSGRIVTTRFLFAMLRTAHILGVSQADKSALERKIGTQLEQATVDDMLIPSYSYAVETLYDVDCIERVVRHFVAEIEHGETPIVGAEQMALLQVGKLVDSYLAEIATDANLKPDKFCELALALPDAARVYDDGLYRAVDIYLKAHTRMPADERDRLCGVVNFRKLTVEACTHAAQNELLPLRAVLQVLFFEQLQLRRAIAGTMPTGDEQQQHRQQTTRHRSIATTWRSDVQENQVLRLDMDSMRTRVHELEKECSSMKKAIQKINGGCDEKAREGDGGNGRAATNKMGLYGCRFSTQVCDAHARSVVESRASRMGMSP